jgi:hypothetical protein
MSNYYIGALIETKDGDSFTIDTIQENYVGGWTIDGTAYIGMPVDLPAKKSVETTEPTTEAKNLQSIVTALSIIAKSGTDENVIDGVNRLRGIWGADAMRKASVELKKQDLDGYRRLMGLMKK